MLISYAVSKHMYVPGVSKAAEVGVLTISAPRARNTATYGDKPLCYNVMQHKASVQWKMITMCTIYSRYHSNVMGAL